MKQIWKEKEIPEEWRTSVIALIYKKRDQERTENYRGISLLCTAYKAYAEILRDKLEIKVKRRKVLSERDQKEQRDT